MYFDYIKELKGYDSIKTDKGFITYGFMPVGDESGCYIEEIYVLPEFRKTGEASELADKVAAIAKEAGCTRLIGSVVPSYKNSDYRLRVLQGYGFILHSSQHDLIYMTKEI